MTTVQNAAPDSATDTFPWKRECPYKLPAQYADIRESDGIRKIRLATGRDAWLATRHADVRQVLNDRRLSADRADPNYPYFMYVPEKFRTNASFLGMDPPEHTVHRKNLAAEFTYPRALELRPEINRVVTSCIDTMLETGGPVDLVQSLAVPVPMAVITALLGVPAHDVSLFTKCTTAMMSGSSSVEERTQGLHELEGFLRELVLAKRAEPTNDVLGRVVAKYVAQGIFDVDVLASMARLLLVAGHETSANMIALGTLTLLEHPDQLDRLKADVSLAGAAAEELLRYLAVADLATSRIATTDLEIGGVAIAKGDGIIAVSAAANRDAAAFPDPDRLDITRRSRHHVSFGYGLHHCLGADLSRLELTAVFEQLFRRIPDLRLAVPSDQLAYKDGAIMYGVYCMPVDW